jgi:DMSO/TMAO reductase YedYZ molybdopterin-dependent catalytic subunit
MKPKKLKKSDILILCILLILALGIAVAVIAQKALNPNTGSDAATEGTLHVSAEGESLKTYTVEEIKAFPAVDIEKNITSGKQSDENGIFTGVPMETILDDADAAWREKYQEFVFSTEDGFASSVFLSDVEKGKNVLVVYAKDGEDLKSSEQGGKGPLRIIVVSDAFGNRSAYWLTGIDAKS